MRLAIVAIVMGTAFIADRQTAAQTLSPGSELAWAGETRYWADNEAGNYADYIKLFDEHFTGWACGRSDPGRKTDIKATVAGLLPRVIVDKKSSVVGAGLVITYYRATWRKDLGDGKTQTIVANFTHTWIPTKLGWKIVGGMCRPAPTE
jgi:hypothetical protein